MEQGGLQPTDTDKLKLLSDVQMNQMLNEEEALLIWSPYLKKHKSDRGLVEATRDISEIEEHSYWERLVDMNLPMVEEKKEERHDWNFHVSESV